MSIAFTFPGQGSQAVGMGKDLAEAFPEAAAVFAEVDDALGEKLSDIMWNGPEETLTLTANAQPALMAVSMAVIRVLEAKGLDLKSKVSFVAGHSLGEYSALCAAGTFSLADTARLLRIRGNAMQAAVPVGKGAMAAIIGLEHDDVEAVCRDASSLGSCRSPRQRRRPAGDLGREACCGEGRGPRFRKGCQARAYAARVRPLPFRLDDAGGRGHAQGARNGREARSRGSGRRERACCAGKRCGRDRAPACRAGDRAGALARDGRVVCGP